ncbi:MAG: flavodoxin [Clostridia bacterium]|nr:flavodoxin [Clostridia bacterium]
MNAAIRYYTRSGNTEKLAMAIADATDIPANSVDEPLSEPVDVLFLGCSYYAFDVDEAVKKFITDNCANIKEIVLFGTSAMMRSMKKPIKKVTDAVGISVGEEEFHCRGTFGALHKGRPNQSDCKNVVEFTKKVLAKRNGL